MTKKCNRMQFTLMALLMGLCFTSGLIAQTEKITLEKYGVTEGLPEEFIKSILQDDQGFMWFSTQNGLVKFDGYSMKVYKASKDLKDSTNLQMQNLNGIIKAKDGKLWFGSVLGDGAYASFNPVTEKFRTYPLASQNNTNNASEVMFEDDDANIWTMNSTSKIDTFEITRLNTKTYLSKSYPYHLEYYKINDILFNGQIVFFKSDKSIWINDNTGNLMVYNSQQDTFNTVIPAGSEIPGTKITDTIKNIFKGNKDHFLLLSKNSMIIWDPIKKSSVKSYTNDSDKDNTFSGKKIGFWAFEDKMGQYWVRLANNNLVMINPENEKNILFTYGQGPLKFPDALKNPKFFLPIFQDEQGIWFGITNNTIVGFIYYNHVKKSFQYYNEQFNDPKNSIKLTPNVLPIFQMIEDKTGYLWFGTRPNFYKEAPKTRQIDLFNHNPKDIFSIPSDTINQIFEDSNQRLWVATRNGIAQKMESDAFKSFYFKNSSGIATSLGNVNEVYEDSKGQIWARTNGNGLFSLNEAKQEFLKCPKNIGQEILAIQEDEKGNIWVSSKEEGVRIIDGKSKEIIKLFSADDKDKHGLLSSEIRTLFLDSSGSMWLGDRRENDFGLFKYNETEENFRHYKKIDTDSLTLNSNEITYINEDDRNRLWVNTDGGINLYDPINDVFYPSKTSTNMSSSHTFVKGSHGKIWVATYAGGGLASVGPDIDDLTMFGEGKGLLHNDITDLVFDDFGKLWLPTERGLSVLDTLTKTFSSYFENDGFQKYSRFNCILKTQNGDIWIGGSHGLNHIIPGKLATKELSVPSVLITSMRIMDSIYTAPDGEIFKKAVSYTDKIELNHWQKNISFDFVGLHFLRPEDNLYSWKLENYDTKWSTPSKERRAAYTNLSPGTYTFRVKASNADGVWNEEGTSLEIVVLPPWWQTWWAYLMYGLVLLFITHRFHLYQKQKTQRIEREKSQQKEIEQAKEIEKAYTDLKSAQAQLIQSEKMASLGELTAGIAHEIQNPLNFVNNFAEVSNELIDEMNEELEKGDLEEVKAISLDIKQNLEKINHHGKRADTIVKGMLEHSRTNSKEKTLTDLNALADEFLKLSYHGLRAKDKSFNSDYELDLDTNLQKTAVVAPDIGRVLLNLINNAFYAVNERAKTEEGFKPLVSVSTKQVGNKVEIKVADNGNGIPETIKDKIFQPFFTTKPTGSGTGLGLSLSYDIIKAHGGELLLKTKEGEGSIFVISLPND